MGCWWWDAAAVASLLEEEKLSTSPQEGRAKNHKLLIRSFPALPLLPRGGVGLGFIAEVGVRVSQACSQLSTHGLCQAEGLRTQVREAGVGVGCMGSQGSRLSALWSCCLA